MTNEAVAIFVAFALAGTGFSDAFANERTLAEIAQGKALVALSACQSDDQCVVVWGGCADVAINKQIIRTKVIARDGDCANPTAPF